MVTSHNAASYQATTAATTSFKNKGVTDLMIAAENYLEKEVFILNDLNVLKDSTIKEQQNIILITEESLLQTKKKNELVIQEQAYTWKKKVWTWSGVSAAAGLILGILLAK